MKRKLLLILVFIVVIAAIYLNRTYARIYSYQNIPGVSTDFSGTYTLENPQRETFQYIALGDSLTAGLGVNSVKETFPYKVAESLQNRGYSMILKIYAKSGATTEDLLEKQLPQVKNQKANLITIFIGTNDLHQLSTPEKFKRNYQQIIDRLKGQDKIVLLNLPYLGSPKLIYPPYDLLIDQRTQQFNQVIAKLAQENNLQYIDLYTPTREAFKTNLTVYSEDQFHPSEKGHQIWAEIIADNLLLED